MSICGGQGGSSRQAQPGPPLTPSPVAPSAPGVPPDGPATGSEPYLSPAPIPTPTLGGRFGSGLTSSKMTSPSY